MTAGSSVTLHSTWRFLIGSALGAVALAVAGTFGVVVAGFNAITTVLFVLGWAFVALVALDVPVAATFDATGVRRHMLVRRQFLGWRSDDRITRARPSIVRQEARLRQGGLVLRRGRRHYLLVDKAESIDEFNAVLDAIDVAGTPGAEVDLTAVPSPPESAPPTWLYRRHRWRPEAASSR
ncbi:MAG: hypothetical protein ACLGHQ_11930 [Acidimicrobiia bacterium]